MRDDIDRRDDQASRHRHTAAKRVLTFAALLFLGGCSQTMNIETASVRQTAPVETAFVIPPPGGPAIVAVIQERQGRSATQQVLLASDSSTPGEDGFHVSISARSGDRIPTPHNINAGMRAALPGTRMVTSPYLTQNRYGPFGYAVGRGGRSDLCLYAWQTIQSRSTLFANQGKVDVRLRLCRARATETQLLAVMYGYTINAFLAEGQWNPYEPAPLPDAVGQRGSEIYPGGANGPAMVLLETAEANPAPRARREKRAVSAQPASRVIVPSPQETEVPPPPPVDVAPTVIVPPPPGS